MLFYLFRKHFIEFFFFYLLCYHVDNETFKYMHKNKEKIINTKKNRPITFPFSYIRIVFFLLLILYICVNILHIYTLANTHARACAERKTKVRFSDNFDYLPMG